MPVFAFTKAEMRVDSSTSCYDDILQLQYEHQSINVTVKTEPSSSAVHPVAARATAARAERTARIRIGRFIAVSCRKGSPREGGDASSSFYDKRNSASSRAISCHDGDYCFSG